MGDESEWLNSTITHLNMPRMETVCQFYDCISTPENYYVVMERVQGQDLLEQIQEVRIEPSESREVVYQIVEGLKGMHCHGRIHKDLKLENVMVDMNAEKGPCSPEGKDELRRRGRISSKKRSPSSLLPLALKSQGVKLIDFDTAMDWSPTSPKQRDVLGTDGYIAPEAYEG